MVLDSNSYDYSLTSYIDRVKEWSYENFKNMKDNYQTIEGDEVILQNSLNNFEEYLNYLYTYDYETCWNAFLKDSDQHKTIISVFPKDKRNVYGYTNFKGHNKKLGNNDITIYLNQMSESKNLTAEQRTKLYAVHEMGHVINDQWMKDCFDTMNEQLRKGNITKEHAEMIYSAFSMLDEATTQNRAENYIYSKYKIERPKMKTYRDNILSQGEIYQSNFDYYGELEEPAIGFAKTLRGIGNENSDIKALDLLSERAKYEDFYKNVFWEYVNDGQLKSFEKELLYMQHLYKASYEKINPKTYNSDNVKNFGIYKDKLKEVTDRMRETRSSKNEIYHEEKDTENKSFNDINEYFDNPER